MKDATNTSFVPPAGWVAREQAGRRFGVSGKTWSDWEREGKVRCGRWFVRLGGGRQRLYPIEAVEVMLREHATFPAGMVDRHAAARMFGVAARTWSEWEHQGRITCGRLTSVLGKSGAQKLYPVEELRRLVEVFRVESARAVELFPPPGMVDCHEGCRMLGIAIRTWVTWESEGKIDCRQWFKVPGKPGRCKLYPVEELRRLRERLQAEERRSEEARKPYPDPDRPGCWRVPVCSEKHQGMEAIVDGDCLSLVEGKRWWWTPGSRDKERGTVGTRINRKFLWLHQIIMGVQGPAYRVAHLNGDPLDCRRENLIVRSQSQQAAAARKPAAKGGKACSSRFKGVHRDPEGCKWSATITQRGRTRQLGRYISEIDAALAYDAAARELYGEHARLNFADPGEAEQLRAAQPAVQSGAFPPPGMIELDGACHMFNVPPVTWKAWEGCRRMPARGQKFRSPSGDDCTLYLVEDLNRLQDQIRELSKPYPDPDRPDVYRVPLMSYVCYREAIIDARSLPLVEGRLWHWQERCDGSGAQVCLTSREGPRVPLARILADVTAAGLDTRVSHRNRDPLDCRLENIIVRSMQEQLFGNRKMGTVNGRSYTSKYKGVSWNERSGKWSANIQKDGKARRLGMFEDEIAAAQAYDEAARELFGEYAWLNFPDGIDAALERAA